MRNMGRKEIIIGDGSQERHSQYITGPFSSAVEFTQSAKVGQFGTRKLKSKELYCLDTASK